MNAMVTRAAAFLLAALGAALAGMAWAEGAENDTATKYRQVHALVGDEGRDPFDAKLAKGPDGNFYGTTQFGGAQGGGTAFRVTPQGDTQVLHAFVAEGGEAVPSGLTWGPDGHFYGVTTFGGSDNQGSFYRMTLDGEETVLYSFKLDQDVPNYWPAHGLMLSADGHFYGVTRADTVYRITPAGEATVLHTFDHKTAGRSPNGGLIEDGAGDLYGTTASGGTFNRGTVYRLTKAGVSTVLHSFAGHRADGAFPSGGLVLVDNLLYGVSHSGGQHRQGSVFRLSTEGGSYEVLHAFKSAKGAPYWPSTGLTRAPDGWLYGASERGGAADGGTVYRINPAGQLKLLHSFGEKRRDGVWPGSDLLLTGQHTFHGTTRAGGVADQGTVYKLTVTD
jgi:uncharacterized repeat protein (TIGR03803 family)